MGVPSEVSPRAASPPEQDEHSGWSLSSYHGNGTHVLLVDGSVRYVSAHIEPAVLKKLATIDKSEAVAEF